MAPIASFFNRGGGGALTTASVADRQHMHGFSMPRPERRGGRATDRPSRFASIELSDEKGEAHAQIRTELPRRRPSSRLDAASRSLHGKGHYRFGVSPDLTTDGRARPENPASMIRFSPAIHPAR
ncbi:hypothetical protein [Aureimonas pseudogalii]|uniref:Uncharacterized protein n=1 Tax=Aureimonas pseudogalii TaxID=1744844 RepID=A0A7W6H1V7_9HYPH|nr:hypothetical protein [Aureimonas pseudogalii]MBB3996331.1 hypothetical protein [Aureimonas pseudogalii]